MNDFDFNFESKDCKVTVLVDDRELKSPTAKCLFELGARLEPRRLEVADFIVSKRIAIERKTDSDFEQSMMDGRLFDQAKALTDNFDSPLICIIGSNFTRVNPKAIRGATISLATNYRIPLFFFDNEKELADFIYHCAEREQLKKTSEAKLRFGKKGFTLEQKQLYLLEGLPGIGPTQAKRLLEHFQTPELVFEADEEDLAQVQGIGEEKAKEIRKTLAQKQE